MEDEIRKRFEEIEKRVSTVEAKLYSTKKKFDGTTAPSINSGTKAWYKAGSTVAKLIDLLNEGFFDAHKTLGEVVAQFATKDYHFKLSDLTLPIRQLVRHGLLRREKLKEKWTYIKIK